MRVESCVAYDLVDILDALDKRKLVSATIESRRRIVKHIVSYSIGLSTNLRQVQIYKLESLFKAMRRQSKKEREINFPSRERGTLSVYFEMEIMSNN